jgi:hypothetical protein
MPAPRQTKVKVYLRSRPCENFANDMIEYGSDGKVTIFKIINYFLQYYAYIEPSIFHILNFA